MLRPALELGSNRALVTTTILCLPIPCLIPRFSPRFSAQPAHLVLTSRKTLPISIIWGAAAFQRCGPVGHLRNEADNLVSSSTCLRLEKDLCKTKPVWDHPWGCWSYWDNQVCAALGLKQVSEARQSLEGKRGLC